MLALLKSAVAALPKACAEDDVVVQRLQVIAARACHWKEAPGQTDCSAPEASPTAPGGRALLGTTCSTCSSSEQ